MKGLGGFERVLAGVYRLNVYLFVNALQKFSNVLSYHRKYEMIYIDHNSSAL